MKINLLKLKLLKLNNFEILQKNIKVKTLLLKFKKAFQVIYSYHLLKKKILFIGNFTKLDKTLIKIIKKKHVFIPQPLWKPNLDKFWDKIISKIKSTSKNFNLVVILNNKEQNIELIKNEFKKKKIPVIFFDYTFNSTVSKTLDYTLINDFSNFKYPLKNNIFYFLLTKMIKKTQLYERKKKIKLNRNIFFVVIKEYLRNAEIQRLKKLKKLKKRQFYQNRNLFKKNLNNRT